MLSRQTATAEREIQRLNAAVNAGRGPAVVAHEQQVAALRADVARIDQYRAEQTDYAAAVAAERDATARLRATEEQATSGRRRDRRGAAEQATQLRTEHAGLAAQLRERGERLERLRQEIGDDAQQSATMTRLAEADTDAA